MIIKVAQHTVRVSYLLIGILLILCALFTITARIGLPLVASYKSNIEQRVSDHLKSPVAIGELSLRWEGFGPLLQAKNVTVFEESERVVSLDELLIDLNLAKSLLRGIPVINELSLVGARLAIEVDADGQFDFHGLQTRGRPKTSLPSDIADKAQPRVDVVAWLFNAGKVGLLDTQLTLIDQTSGMRTVIDELNIRAENQGNVRQLRIEAELPEELGGRIEAGIDMTGEANALSYSDGVVYLSAQSLDLRGVRTLAQLSGFVGESLLDSLAVDARGTVELWGEWQDGELLSVRGPISVGTVVDVDSGEILLNGLMGQFRATRDNSITKVVADDIVASLGLQTLNIDEVSFTQNLSDTGEQSESWQLDARAEQMQLDLLLPVIRVASSVVPLSVSEDLLESSLSGELNNVALNVSGAAPSSLQASSQPPLFDLEADIKDVAFDGQDSSLPTIGPLSGSMSMVGSQGQLTLVGEQMPLSWSVASDEDLLVDEVDAGIDIDMRDMKRLKINADVEIADNGIDTDTRIEATLVPGVSPHLDIQSSFEAADITAVKDWVPGNLLNPLAADWIDSSITAGSASEGSLLFFGHLADFPFNEGEGVLRATVDLSDAQLSFLPDWPAARQINGKLELDGLKLTGVAEDGLLDRFRVSQTRVVIPDLSAAVLELDITADGDFQDVVDFGLSGPLRDILEPAISDVTGIGLAQMDLDLVVSLFDQPAEGVDSKFARAWRPFEVNGSLFLDGNNVAFGRADLGLKDVTGAVNFDELGIAVNNLSAVLLGHNVNVNGSTVQQGDTATTIVTVKGAIEANDLLADMGNPLDQFIRGASQWNATLTVPHSVERIADEGVSLVVTSDLVGTELLLPVPFNKGTSTAAAFTLSTAFREDEMLLLDVRYADELRTRVTLQGDDLESVLVELGADTIAEQSFDFDELDGIRVQGRLARLSADGWVETISRYIDSLPEDEEGQEPILPISMALDADAMLLGERSMGKASLRSNTDPTYVNFTIANQAVKGNLRYPRAHWSKELALKARIELLDWSVIDALSDTEEEALGAAEDSDLDPRELPPIDARITTLVKDKVRIRDIVLRAESNVNGLDVTTFGFAYDTMNLVGQGSWYFQEPQNASSAATGHSSQLNLVLQTDDFGVGLEEVGLSGIINEGQGTVAMQLSWPGPLYSPEIARLDGDVAVDMQAGSIVPLEPGAGRVVGLFALQALPRRLNLDFKDLTSVGLAFTSITGTAKINDGVADIPLLQLTGPIGVVDIIGQSDLNAEEFDQQITVLPRISAALPVIGAISAGATGGIGVLVAAGFLKALGVDFDRIGLRSYRLTGPWLTPLFTPMSIDLIRRR